MHFLRSGIVILVSDKTGITKVISKLTLLILTATSDPFVRVSLDQKVVGRTQTRKSDLNPVWEEEFTIPLDELPSSESDTPVIKFEIFNVRQFSLFLSPFFS